MSGRDPMERAYLRAAAGILIGLGIGTILWLVIGALIVGARS